MTAHCWLLWALEAAEGGAPLELVFFFQLLLSLFERGDTMEALVPWPEELRSSETMSSFEPPPPQTLPPVVTCVPVVSEMLLEEIMVVTGVDCTQACEKWS